MLTAHPHLPEFEYILPENIAEASRFLYQNPVEARVFMGGTDILVRLRNGDLIIKYLVDVKKLEGMNDITFDPDAGLRMGSAVNMNRIIESEDIQRHYPLLVEASKSVASYQLRSRATIVGNICNASPAGDTIGACLVLNASLGIHGPDGYRIESLNGFFRGPGETLLNPGDIVTGVIFPLPPHGSVSKYIKLGRNKVGDLAIIGVTVMGYVDETCPSGFRFRIALASVASIPLIASGAEQILAERKINEETIKNASLSAMEACDPIDDVRGGKRYRKLMVRNLTERAIAHVWAKIKDSVD